MGHQRPIRMASPIFVALSLALALFAPPHSHAQGAPLVPGETKVLPTSDAEVRPSGGRAKVKTKVKTKAKAKAKVKTKARAQSHAKTMPSSASEPSPPSKRSLWIKRVFPFGLTLLMAALWWSHRRKPEAMDQPTGPKETTTGPFKAKRSKAPRTASLKINPAEITHNNVVYNESARATIVTTPYFPPPPSAADLLPDDDEDCAGPDDKRIAQKISETIDQLINYRRESREAKQRPAPSTPKSPLFRRPPALRLPRPMHGRFEGRFGEEVLWNAPIERYGQILGWAALTNLRLLWVIDRPSWTLGPWAKSDPKTSAHQMDLADMTGTQSESVDQPLLLVPALGLVWWYPWGAMLAVFLVVIYAFSRSPALTVSTLSKSARLFVTRADLPLGLRRLEEARASLGEEPQPDDSDDTDDIDSTHDRVERDRPSPRPPHRGRNAG